VVNHSLPVHVTHKVAHIRESASQLPERLDRETTAEEVANDLDLGTSWITAKCHSQ
jgi:hypothetical protein